MTRPELYAAWIDAKAAETQATDARRTLEDQIIAELEIDAQLDGTVSGEEDGFKVKITGRLNHKVDADAARKVAGESPDAAEYFTALFRWKPDLALTEWRKAPEAVRAAYAVAITTSAGRPSISIERVEPAKE